MASRSIVKHSYIRSGKGATGKARAHVRYIKYRPGRDGEEKDRHFFNGDRDDIDEAEVLDAVTRQPKNGVLMHKVILSPGLPKEEVQAAATAVMADLASQKGLDLEWYGVTHSNTDNPHTHVVIMGRARDGRAVKITKRDHQDMRESGDRYLEKHRSPENRTIKERIELIKEPFNKLVEAINEESKSLKISLLKPVDKTEASRHLKPVKDKEGIGEKPSKELLEARDLRRQEKERRLTEKRWKEYCQPMSIDYAKGTHLEGLVPKAKVDRSMTLDSLKEVEAEYARGDKSVRSSISEKDHERLQSWISEKEQYEKKLYRQTQKVKEITARLYGEKDVRWGPASSRVALEELKWLDERAIVVLSEPERQALNRWSKGRDIAGRLKDHAEEKGQNLKRPLRVDRSRHNFKSYSVTEKAEALAKQIHLQKTKDHARDAAKMLNSGDRQMNDESVYSEVYGADLSAVAAGPMGATLGGTRSLGPGKAITQVQGAIISMNGRIAAQGMVMHQEAESKPAPTGPKSSAGRTPTPATPAAKSVPEAPQPAKSEGEAKTQGQQKAPGPVASPIQNQPTKLEPVKPLEEIQKEQQRKIEEQQLRERRKKRKDKDDPNRDSDKADEWTR